MLREYYLIHQNTVSLNLTPAFYQKFIRLKYSIAWRENSTYVLPYEYGPNSYG